MALIAHVLHAHRLAHQLRHDGRIHGHIARIVAAVGARSRHPDRVNLFHRDAETAGDALRREMRLLRAGPHRDGPVGAHIGDRAARSHAGMGLERPFIFGFDDFRGLGESGLDVALLLLVRFGDGRLADVVVELRLIDERIGDLRPGHLQLLRGFDRVPFPGRDHADEVALADKLGARNAGDGGFIHRDHGRARDGRADHAAMQHAVDADVRDPGAGAEHLALDVQARRRGADDFVLLVALGLGGCGQRQRVAILVVPADLRMEIAAADHLGIADLLRRIAHNRNDAVIDGQPLDRHAQFLGRAGDEHAARFGAGHAQRRAGKAHARAARGAALIDGARGVALHHGDVSDRHVELFGDDHGHGEVGALAAVDLAEEHRHRAVGRDGDPGIQFGRNQRRLAVRSSGRGQHLAGIGHGEGNDQTAGALQHSAARK